MPRWRQILGDIKPLKMVPEGSKVEMLKTDKSNNIEAGDVGIVKYIEGRRGRRIKGVRFWGEKRTSRVPSNVLVAVVKYGAEEEAKRARARARVKAGVKKLNGGRLKRAWGSISRPKMAELKW